MKTVFLDTDIILDLVLDRKPHAEGAAAVFDLAVRKKIKAITTPVVVSNLFYILNDKNKLEDVTAILRKILRHVHVCIVDQGIVNLALASEWTDFEDAIQYYAALHARADVLITRNKKDFKKSDIPILSAEEFKARIKTS